DDGVRRDRAAGARGRLNSADATVHGPRPSGHPRRMRLRPNVAIVAVLAVLVTIVAGCAADRGAPAARPAAAHAGDGRFFAPSSVWNRRLPANAPVAPNSGALVAGLRQQVRSAGPWIATSDFSVPVVRVGARQRRVRVKLD